MSTNSRVELVSRIEATDSSRTASIAFCRSVTAARTRSNCCPGSVAQQRGARAAGRRAWTAAITGSATSVRHWSASVHRDPQIGRDLRR